MASHSNKTGYDFSTCLINAFEQNIDPEIAEGTVVCISSCAQGNGSSEVVKEVIEKALSMGKRVTFIDFHSKQPVSLNLEDKNQFGLLAYLSSSEIVSTPGIITWVSPQQGDRLNEDLTSKEASSIVNKAKEMADLVLVRPPAILNNSYTEMIVTLCDQIYFVMKQQKTSYYEVNYAISRARHVGKEPCGLIFNARKLPIPEFFYRMFFRAG